MAKTTSNKYWETEKPVSCNTLTNLCRHYKEARKLQVYKIMETSATGLSKGVTIDLENMADEAFLKLETYLLDIIAQEKAIRGMTTDGKVDKSKAKKKKPVKKIDISKLE